MSFLRRCLASTALCLLPHGFALAQTVTTLVNPTPADGIIYGFLMTDGTVLCQGGNISDWYKFSPDKYGSYQNGTWSSVAGTPAGYAPYATGGGVLPDGRLLLTGGEYLLNKAGTNLVFALTPQSAIYDPVSNAWTPVAPPAGWFAIGDSPGAVLAGGRFLLGDKITTAAAELDARTLQWRPVSTMGKQDINAEEGWTLLPSGSIVTGDVTDAPESERFLPDPKDPGGSQWVTAGDTPVNLKFTWTGSQAKPLKYDGDHFYKPAGEIGPAILRPDGTVFATGALTKGATAGHTAIYHPGAHLADPGVWTAGPDFAAGDDAGDEYAVLLPNGNALVEANTNGADVDHDAPDLHARRVAALLRSHAPVTASLRMRAATAQVAAAANPCAPNPLETYHLYEFDGTSFTLENVDVTTCGNSLSMLVLPTGETFIGGVGLYTPATGNPAPDWAPAVTDFPRQLARGGTYQIFGKRFNGMSQAAAYGDEFPTPTNYPLVRITNAATGLVVYARTHDHSSMGVATGERTVSTHFDLPDTIQPGPSLLEVVANGIASRAVSVMVR